MVSFDKNTPVLRLTQDKAPNSKWILWPVLTWRVVAPVPKECKLNIFQRAVLGFACAGVTRVNEISERLLIADDLAALIVLELQNMALLDYAGCLTPRGIKFLDDIGDVATDETKVGHVFSDTFSGKLWPRFLVGDLPFADVEINDKGWPVLLSGSVGNPWKDSAFCVISTNVIEVKPKPREILQVARRHRRQRNLDEVFDERDAPRLKQISFIDDVAEPYLMALRARSHESGDWIVDDPFGHGESVELRNKIEERLDKQKGLREWLAPLIGADTSVPTSSSLHIEAIWEVEKRLTLSIRSYDVLLDRLVAMQRAFLEANIGDAPVDKWDDVVVKAQKAAERVFHVVQQSYLEHEGRFYRNLAERDKAFNHRYLNAIARDLGFQTPLPEALTSVKRGKIQFAEGKMQGGLQPILLVALLWAEHESNHPLRTAANIYPDLLHRLHDLAFARDRFAAHDGSQIWSQNVPQFVETVFISVESLLLPNLLTR